MEMTIAIALIVGAYLLGSIASAVLVGRLLGAPDPRNQGSGNPGATNMLRIGGKKAGALTLLGDMLKGLVPVLLAHALGATPQVIAACALAAFLGHLYPVFFGFKGGKGVATFLGALLGIHWMLGAAAIATWLLIALIVRISSVSALVAALLSPVYCWWITQNTALTGAVGLMVLLIYWRHRSNIRNVMNGTEGRIELGKS